MLSQVITRVLKAAREESYLVSSEVLIEATGNTQFGLGLSTRLGAHALDHANEEVKDLFIVQHLSGATANVSI